MSKLMDISEIIGETTKYSMNGKSCLWLQTMLLTIRGSKNSSLVENTLKTIVLRTKYYL